MRISGLVIEHTDSPRKRYAVRPESPPHFLGSCWSDVAPSVRIKLGSRKLNRLGQIEFLQTIHEILIPASSRLLEPVQKLFKLENPPCAIFESSWLDHENLLGQFAIQKRRLHIPFFSRESISSVYFSVDIVNTLGAEHCVFVVNWLLIDF